MLPGVAIVSDGLASIETAASILALEGFRVTTFSHFVDLFHSIPYCQPQVIVLDLRIWTIREQALATVLRERLSAHPTRFILITSVFDLARSVPDAIDVVLVRPFAIGELRRAIIGGVTSALAYTAAHPAIHG